MNRVLFGLVLATAVGCGGGSKPIAPLTDEQKADVAAKDKFTDDEEKAGSGKSTRKK